ncbi:MAG TPA: lysylphosphatidylglycerol synthase domain-containing protein [Gaiellaceae bacterium]
MTAAAVTTVFLLVAATPQLLGARINAALDLLGEASPEWLWLAVLGFVCSLVGAAGAWCSAVRLCGGRLGLLDANGRYGVGSLVNTFVPARAGDAVRIALFSRTVDHPDRLWATGGAVAAVGAARAVGLGVLVVCGAALGATPLWPLLVVGALTGLVAAVAWKARTSVARSHAAHVLDAFRALGREPLAGARILGWVGLATAGRVGAAAAVAAALGVPRPLAAALIIVPALDLAGMMPLTPGNLGIASGAVAMALQAHGVGLTEAISAGIAFHALETAISVLYGTVGALVVAGDSITGTRRWVLAGVAACAALATVAALGTTVFADLV